MHSFHFAYIVTVIKSLRFAMHRCQWSRKIQIFDKPCEQHVRVEVLTASVMKSPISWDTNHAAHWKLTDVMTSPSLNNKPNQKPE
jgi:fatty-acid desaturase